MEGRAFVVPVAGIRLVTGGRGTPVDLLRILGMSRLHVASWSVALPSRLAPLDQSCFPTANVTVTSSFSHDLTWSSNLMSTEGLRAAEKKQ